ncbi:16S rRNA (cytosine(1402)-N(4))-methyltransferase RsmH [Candidatus Peregrinibacteria bacterium]|nr:MAG: 16S rRNA (cytosine(1402)-N(4))-methyltransferase RsmH [Candidatus Peregrinibacteria bacterium]
MKNEYCSLTHSLPSSFEHHPVLLQEVLHLLNIRSSITVVDATLGLGGHSEAFLNAIGDTGKLIAFEWDERNRLQAEKRLEKWKKKYIVPKSFSHLEFGCREHGISEADAILFDIGISSAHLDDASRGFSYRNDGPLDMRMDTKQSVTAELLLKESSEEELRMLFRNFGEEPQARRIASAIVEERKKFPLQTTSELFALLNKVCPRNSKKVSSRIFQALRIAVNDELGELRRALPQAAELLSLGGRLAVISFHSLEDRIVKQFFRGLERSQSEEKKWRRVNKKVIIPDDEEQKRNPRSRSAKLRVLERIPLS